MASKKLIDSLNNALVSQHGLLKIRNALNSGAGTHLHLLFDFNFFDKVAVYKINKMRDLTSRF